MKTPVYYFTFLIIGSLLGIVIGNLIAPLCPTDNVYCDNNLWKYPLYGCLIGVFSGLIIGKIIRIFKK
jgi:hypothetical protein